MRLTPLRRAGAASTVACAVLAGTPIFGGCEAAGQSGTARQLWVDYNPSLALGSSYDLVGEAGWRTRLGERGWSRYTLRAHVRQRDGGLEWAAGASTFYTRAASGSDVVELRPFQGLRTRWPNGRFLRIDHYLRAEERFLWGGSWDGADVSLRLRYRLQTEWAVSGFRDRASWRLLLNAEAFSTITKEAARFDEASRLGLGVERSVAETARLRLDVIWQRSTGLFVSPFDESSLDAIYFRLRLFQRFAD